MAQSPDFSNDDLVRWKKEINPAPIIRKRIPSLRRENAEWVGTCPPCYHDAITGHPDKSPSLKLYKLDGGTWAFKCFGCGACGNIFQFIQKFDNVTFKRAVEVVLTEAGVEGWQDGAEQTHVSLPDPEKKAIVTFPISAYLPAVKALEQSAPAQAWLLNRGITMQTARKFSLGFVQSAAKITSTNAWLNDGWVLFPTLSVDGQTVTSVKYRSLIAKKLKIAGRENSGILRAPDTSTTLYNAQTVRGADDIWVVEGEPDTLVLSQIGLPTVGYPMAGYKPTDEECDLLSSAKRRFLAGDNDPSGNKAMETLQKRLRGATYVIKWPNNRKDANDVLTNECDNDPDKFREIVMDLQERATQTESISVTRKASAVVMKKIRWLWPDRVPLGKITLFCGNPDNGKSICSTGVAAICSAGGEFPESHFPFPASEVLMLIGEDDIDDTVVPRLKAAQANLDRIHILESVRPVKAEDREVRLDMDIPAIERKLAAHSDIRLVVIDPISNYLGEVSMVAEQEVRSILIPLKRLAEKFNVAVIIVMHLNKKSDQDAITRVGGAMAFIGVARCSWLFTRNVQEDESSEDGSPAPKKPDTFSMLRIKNNLVSSSRAGLSYSVAVRPVKIEGEDVFTPYVVWGNVIEGSADEALGAGRRQQSDSGQQRVGRPNIKLQSAIKWLENALQDGLPHATKKLKERAKGEANITSDTLDRAWDTIGAKSENIKGLWCWKIDPMRETGEPETDEDVPVQSSFIRVEGAE